MADGVPYLEDLDGNKVDTHPWLFDLLNNPNPTQSWSDVIFTLSVNDALYSNSFAYAPKRSFGIVNLFVPLPSNQIVINLSGRRLKQFEDEGLIDSFTFYSYEQASHFDAEQYAEEVARTVEALSIPVIVNVDCQSLESWLTNTAIIAEAGPAAMEINVSCPHGSIAFSGQDVERRILEVVEGVRAQVDLPLIVKLTPQLTSPHSFVKAVEEIGAEAVTLFNRFTGLDVDIETGRPVMHGGYAGHGDQRQRRRLRA